MQRLGANLGGEQSGHLLFPDHAPTGDGILSALAAPRGSSGRRASRSPRWPGACGSSPRCCVNVPVARKPPFDSVAGLAERIQAYERGDERHRADPACATPAPSPWPRHDRGRRRSAHPGDGRRSGRGDPERDRRLRPCAASASTWYRSPGCARSSRAGTSASSAASSPRRRSPTAGARRDPVPHFAARFAAKEAGMKALGTGLRLGVKWRELEVRRERGSAPTLDPARPEPGDRPVAGRPAHAAGADPRGRLRAGPGHAGG